MYFSIVDQTCYCNGFSSTGENHTPRIASMSKIFCDPVHGQISLHPICVAIIDTPEFQRLRNIKQNGLLEYVYPGATHNRFCHSLGVSALASKFIQQLRERQPELDITSADVLCVEIAGLCHDLGHGPLSHLWEDFMRESNKLRDVKLVWSHEKVSQNLFDYLVQKNKLMPELKKFGIGFKEMKMIKDLIAGNQPLDGEKAFIYQIVNNEDSGLDVDKWDYFLRDCYYLGLPCSFDYQRLMQFSRILTVNGRKQICFRDKVLENVYNVFRTRSILHKLAYQHKVVKVLDTMFCDAVLEADGKVTGPSGEKLNFWDWSMSAAFSHGDKLATALEKYCTLTENLVFSSLKYCSPSLQNVSSLITAIERRSCKCCGMYQMVASKISPVHIDKAAVYEGIAKLLPLVSREVLHDQSHLCEWKNKCDESAKIIIPLSIRDIHIQIISIHWGKKDKNPVEFVHFYAKNNPMVVESINHEESFVILPKTFEEIQIFVICRRSDKYATEVTRKCFEEYWTQTFQSNGHV